MTASAEKPFGSKKPETASDGIAGGTERGRTKGRTMASEGAFDVHRLAVQAIAVTPTLDAIQARVAVGLHRLLAEGEPVSVDRLSERLGMPPSQVAAILADIPAIFYDADGKISGFWGLSIAELPATMTKHRLMVAGRTLYAWCAADTLWLPRVLGKAATIGSTFATSGRPISLVVTPDGIECVSVKGAAMSMVRPEGKQFDDNVLGVFCHHILFFPSEDEGRSWARGRPDIVISPLAEGFELMRRWVDGVFGLGGVEPK